MYSYEYNQWEVVIMKGKHLIIVTLLLAILTMGAVSASEDVIADDELAANDVAEDSVLESPEEVDLMEKSEYFPDIDTSLEIYDEIDLNAYGAEQIAYVGVDSGYIDGTISLSVDDVKCYEKTISAREKIDECSIYTDDLSTNVKVGTHKVMLSYLKKGLSAKTLTDDVKFFYTPDVDYTDEISTGSAAIISIEHLSSSGSAVLYNDDGGSPGSILATATISGGSAKMFVNGLAKGDHDVILKMTVNGESYEKYFTIYVSDNTPGYSATVTPKITVGQSATVTFSGPKIKGTLTIYVDGKEIKRVNYYGGSLVESIAGLSIGSHQVTLEYSKGSDFYSKNFNVNVVKKPDTISLTLKKVTVKKSAKKLTLQATLKINKKAVKGKKVTFKFNGKKYTAKTNAKGVAKVIIKKKVLKKLKVGKKLTYTVKYSTKTVKKTVKVKK